MTLRLASASLASLLLCTACPSDDEGETSSGETETGVADDTGTETETATDTDTGTETDTGPTCGVAAGVCCMELEACEATEDCCEPDTYSCVLEGPTLKCIDLVAMCEQCLMNCPAPPDVCESSCAIWCNPP